MSDTVITPRRDKGEPLLPVTGILAVNPSDTSTLTTLAKEHGLQRHFLFNAHLFSGPQFFIAGPAVGAPMAALCLEKLIALGARRLVIYGWCGSLLPTLHIGDLLLPTSGISEEGTSQHYVSGHQWDATLHIELFQGLRQLGRNPISGAIWTTDALYRETRNKVEQYAGQGIMAVDMEYTALQSVATFRRVQLAAVLLVSDELFSPSWNPGYSQKHFRTLSRQTLALLCSFVA